MLIKNLIDFGLSEKEAKVYVALLELEAATANEVAKKTEINRSSTYVVLESLKKQGFVNISVDKTIKQYVATPPEALLHLAKKRAEKQEGIKTMMESIMPDLKALHKDTKHKPKVMVYEGVDSMKTLYYKETSKVKSGEEFMRSYEDLSVIEEMLPGYVEIDCIERKNKSVKLYAINPNTKANRDTIDNNIDTQYQDINLLIPEKLFRASGHPVDFAVYGDEVTFYSLKESFGIVIKHQEIADTLKSIFDLAWKEAERIGLKK